MRVKDNVTAPGRVTSGILLGALGVLAFSFTLPVTRISVAALDPWFVAFGRAAVAGVLAIGYLALSRPPRPVTGQPADAEQRVMSGSSPTAAQPDAWTGQVAVDAEREFPRGSWPTAAQLRRLVVVACGVVIGFPLFTSIALTQATAAHGAVVIALLPAATAVFAVVRGGERPSPKFWLAAGAGFAAVLGFVAVSGGMAGGFRAADLWFLAAVVVCALGYAEGGALARELGGARTICWALVLALPVTIPVAVVSANGLGAAAGPAWLGFAYVALVSQFLGFFAWYAGLARGGVARIGQIQAVQPVLTLAWSVVLLHEHVDVVTVVVAVVVLGCVVLTQRAR
ncbi:DMT family transporter [Kutzneria kofuensis]|uniref:Drug/metabolite transporter (DMT)-like permease n=1 Tax=Kutzneria kofuensis TaxID=103725 RepID=A0A7W9KLE5_9PSEU|nr:DMT family transporter [Kutzneria kofuensis]MBB5894737.1 drug/metabolite transporter (DMT)-like permease [Kutzneria kofuensis]